LNTTAYYCPRCGCTADVTDGDPIPDCSNCNGPLVLLVGQGGRRGRRTAIVSAAPVQDCNQRPNPFYRHGEG